jgi:hypothetical protein
MSWFPQVGAGSVAQFPLNRSRQWRMISNDLESGERIALADQYSNQIQWALSYQDLSDAEVLTFTNLFAASQGQAGSFGFIDPLANLLGWSEDFTRPDWQAGSPHASSGVADPLGTQRAWLLVNGSPGPLTLQQTLGLPGEYMACFSVWVRSANRGTAVLQRDSLECAVPVGTVWKRAFMGGRGVNGASQSSFGITLAAGQQIEMFGPQVEAQPYPSAYKQTTTPRGIYQQTTFATDELNVVSTGKALSACQISLMSRF